MKYARLHYDTPAGRKHDWVEVLDREGDRHVFRRVHKDGSKRFQRDGDIQDDMIIASSEDYDLEEARMDLKYTVLKKVNT